MKHSLLNYYEVGVVMRRKARRMPASVKRNQINRQKLKETNLSVDEPTPQTITEIDLGWQPNIEDWLSDDIIEELEPRHYWSPNKSNQRFPTEANILLGSMNDDFTKIYEDLGKLQRANIWRQNYAKSIRVLMDNAVQLGVDDYLIDGLDQVYWDVLNISVDRFLQAQNDYSNELNVRINYLKLDLEMNTARIIEIWKLYV